MWASALLLGHFPVMYASQCRVDQRCASALYPQSTASSSCLSQEEPFKLSGPAFHLFLIFYYTMQGHLAVCKLLLRAGAAAQISEGPLRPNPLVSAAYNGHKEVCAFAQVYQGKVHMCAKTRCLP
eukprot:1158308-Pelagomonas_calceolata.AAC.7